jgi:hypothetical protein
MSINPTNAGQAGVSNRLEAQALRLWTFVHRRASSFSPEQALATLRELEPSDSEEIRPFAKRLRRALEKYRVKIVHTASLQAAALVLRDEGWFQARQDQPAHTLKLHSFTGDADEPIADWHQAGRRLVAICEQWLQRNPHVRVFQIQSTPTALIVSSVEIGSNPTDREWPTMPIAVINPAQDNDQWLVRAGSALEALRRRLEETHLALLDGLAVIEWCSRSLPPGLGLPSISANDACNSELVLMRRDYPVIAEVGYEIVRGDELACWTQFDLAMDARLSTVSVDDDGGWVCGDARFAWNINTLLPKEFIPGLVMQQVGPREAQSLLHRYRLSKRILGRKLPARTGRKRLQYLGGPAETYRVNLHELLLAMKRADLTWEGYCEEIGEAGRAMTPELPLGFVMSLVLRLGIDDPDSVFARPTRAELARADDDSVLRALMPRVDHVRYRTCQGLPSDSRETVREAIAELSTSILMRLGAFQISDPLPDLVYASDGEELMAKLEELGLVAYVGVMPHFRKIPKETELPPERWPYAFGHSLYLDIDLRGA